MDISKCNQFLASAGKDAQILIWELYTGKLLFRLRDHTNLINRIQFFSPIPEKSAKDVPKHGSQDMGTSPL